MAKPKTKAAQDRIELKKGVALREREGRANLAAAVIATQTGVHFANGDLALGLMREAQTMSPARRSKLIASGRKLRLSLVPAITGDTTAVDLVARIPADLEDISDIAQQLVSLGLRSSRKRARAP